MKMTFHEYALKPALPVYAKRGFAPVGLPPTHPDAPARSPHPTKGNVPALWVPYTLGPRSIFVNDEEERNAVALWAYGFNGEKWETFTRRQVGISISIRV
jgi:hypothetical protein